MRRSLWLDAAVSGVLAFFLSFAGCGCLVTAFALEPVALGWVALVCALSGGAFCLLLTLFQGKRLLFLAAGAAAVLLLCSGKVLEQLESLVYQISGYYNSAYGWGRLNWSGKLPIGVPVTGGLALLGGAVAAVNAWVLCRRKNAVFAAAASALPLAACMVVTDTVPSAYWLFLLLSGLLLLVVTQPVRRRAPKAGIRAVALALVPVLLLSGMLFQRNTQEQFGLQTAWLQSRLQELLSIGTGAGQGDGPGNAQWMVTGAVDLTKVGRLEQPQYAVMDVRTDQTGTVYLRGQSLDTYDGEHWYASIGAVGTADPYFPNENLELIEYMNISMRLDFPLQFVPYYVDYYTLSLGMVVSQAPIRERRYAVYGFREGESHWNSYSANGIYRELAATIREQNLQLPEHSAEAITQELLRLFPLAKPGREGDRAAFWAERIASVVRNYAPYSLNTERMPEGQDDFVLWFLRKGTQTGYCVHYASTMVMLLRAAGIPARYVSGYAFESAGGKSTVRGYHAHAWAEYLDPDNGWTVIDATPASWMPSPEPTEDETLPTEETTEPAPTPAPTEPPTQMPTQEPTSDTQQQEQQGDDRQLLWLLPSGIGLLWGQYALRKYLRRREKRPNRRALRLWRETEILARLTKQPPPERLEQLAEKAKFSQHTLSENELREFELWLGAAQKALKKQPWPVRLVLRLIWAI